MTRLYYNKIKNAETNAQTNKAWCLEDVPILWRSEVEALLENQDESD